MPTPMKESRESSTPSADREDRASSPAKGKGLAFRRYFTKVGRHPYDELAWELRSAVINDERGQPVFEQHGIEAPATWSQTATNIVASKYFRGKLSSPDREQFTDYEGSLKTELQDYLGEHARREGYVLLTPPAVLFETDDDLAVGEFGIATRMAQGEPRGGEAAPARPLEQGATMVYRPRTPIPPEGPAPDVALAQEIVTLTMDGVRHEIDKRRFVLGRSKDCDIQLADPNVSRRHAELRQEGSAYWLIDLDSTNGSQVNGRRTARAKLESGDTITVGSTDLVFERRLAD